MKATIEIECETAGELLAHLDEIARTVRARSRENTDHDFETGTAFSYNNCIGTHEVIITCEP